MVLLGVTVSEASRYSVLSSQGSKQGCHMAWEDPAWKLAPRSASCCHLCIRGWGLLLCQEVVTTLSRKRLCEKTEYEDLEAPATKKPVQLNLRWDYSLVFASFFSAYYEILKSKWWLLKEISTRFPTRCILRSIIKYVCFSGSWATVTSCDPLLLRFFSIVLVHS